MSQQVKQSRLAGMDGVRGLAACAVLVFHCWFYDPSAGAANGTEARFFRLLASGVMVFFSLSGLLLYRPFAAAVLGVGPRPALRRYARNRVLRILPAYWFVLFLVAVVGDAAVLPEQGFDVGRMADQPGVLVANFFLAQSYRPEWLYTGIAPAWSLSVEVAFYFVLPVVSLLALRLAARWTSRRVLVCFLPPLAMLMIGLTGKTVAVLLERRDTSWDEVAITNFLAQADLFAFGMVVAVLSVLCEMDRLTLPRSWRPWTIGAAWLAVVVAFSVPDGEITTPIYDVIITLAASLGLATLVLGRGQGSRAVRVFDSRVLTAVGAASFGLYLWHEPVIHWLRGRGLTVGNGDVRLLSTIFTVAVIAGALAWLTNRFVEAPALRQKRALVTSDPAPEPPALLAAGEGV